MHAKPVNILARDFLTVRRGALRERRMVPFVCRARLHIKWRPSVVLAYTLNGDKIVGFKNWLPHFYR